MPRHPRVIVGGFAYHILNRANAKATLFEKPADYAAFVRVLEEAHLLYPLRILGYCVMPNHWHLVIWPDAGQEQRVTHFMRWLTATHSRRWHEHRETSGTGHVYQGRYKSFPIQEDNHLLTVLRYVERNALRAGLVQRAEHWHWSSLSRWLQANHRERSLLSDWPVPGGRPHDWLDFVNLPQTQNEVEAIHRCIRRGTPHGNHHWVHRVAKTLGLEYTIRALGRPKRLSKGLSPFTELSK